MDGAVGAGGVRVLAIADDLSGAAETAAALALPPGRGTAPVAIHLGAADDSGAAAALAPGVTVIDLDSRALSPVCAGAAVRAAAATAPAGTRVYAKVDSLWRGNVAATVAALLGPGRPVVFAPALPAAWRRVVGGRPFVDGVPLGDTAGWALESRPAPHDLGELLAGLPVAPVPLETVRAGAGSLAAVFAAASASGPVVLACDAETDTDLDAIAAAADALPGARLVGSGGLAGALGRLLASRALDRDDAGADAAAPGARTDTPPRPHPLLLIGTAEPVARRQIAELARHADVEHVRLGAAEILGAAPGLPAARARLNAALVRGPAVVDVDPALPGDRDIAPAGVRAAISATLADLARSAGRRDLMLTGGETARFVLDALGIDRLAPLHVLDIGTIASAAPDGRTVVTRPGSFGGDDNLVLVHDHLREERDRP